MVTYSTSEHALSLYHRGTLIDSKCTSDCLNSETLWRYVTALQMLSL